MRAVRAIRSNYVVEFGSTTPSALVIPAWIHSAFETIRCVQGNRLHLSAYASFEGEAPCQERLNVKRMGNKCSKATNAVPDMTNV
jgi:hypothetical protein